VFVRGKNNGRPSGGNPEERDLGEYQQDEVKQHSHSTVQMIGNNDADGVDSTATHSGEHHNESRETGSYGGNETRPRSVTVNFFIKVAQ
jgi:hypothetical protein